MSFCDHIGGANSRHDERHHHRPGSTRQQAFVFWPSCDAKPQHVHRRADFFDLKPASCDGMAAVAGNGQIGPNVTIMPSGVAPARPQSIAAMDEIVAPLHVTLSEVNRVAGPARKLKIHWHEGVKGYFVSTRLRRRSAPRCHEHPLHFLQFDGSFEIRRSIRVRPSPAASRDARCRRGNRERSRMLLQHYDIDPRVQQISQHHAGGAAADDAAADLHGARRRRFGKSACVHDPALVGCPTLNLDCSANPMAL